MTRSRTRNAMTVVTAKAAEDVLAEQTQSLRLLLRNVTPPCLQRSPPAAVWGVTRESTGTFANISE